MAAIRAALAKGRGGGDAVLAAAAEAAGELEEKICRLHHIQGQGSAQGGGTRMSPARVVAASSHRTLKLHSHSLTRS